MTEECGRFVIGLVGTDHHPFDRLVGWIDDWYREQPIDTVRCLVQHGTSSPPRFAKGIDWLARDQLLVLLESAHAVVCHGGPSTILEALRRGRFPFVVARAPELGEHVDDHQMAFAAVLARRGWIRLISSCDELADALSEEVLAPEPATVAVELSEPTVAAGTLADHVGRILAGGPTRRLRWLRRPHRR